MYFHVYTNCWPTDFYAYVVIRKLNEKGNIQFIFTILYLHLNAAEVENFCMIFMPQLRRSLGGILVLASLSVRLSVTLALGQEPLQIGS